MQSVIDIRREHVALEACGPVQRPFLELCDLGLYQAECWHVCHVPWLEDQVDMTVNYLDKFKHILRDSIRRRALLALDDR